MRGKDNNDLDAMLNFTQFRLLVDVIWTHPANRGRRIRAMGLAAAWQLYKRTIGRPIDIEAFGGKFRCFPDSQDAGRMIYFDANPDPQEMAFLKCYLRRGDRVIDAGANVGVYTLFLASLVGPEGHVLAFEPDPKAADRLRENIRLNALENVTVRQSAVSNFVGSADFTQGADGGNALYSVRTYDRPPQQVEVTTLDVEIDGDSYQFCKMDIEGAEWDALKGTAESLGRANPPVWLIELSEKLQAKVGATVSHIEAWLNERGYALWRYDPGAGELVPFVSLPRKLGHVGDAIAIAEAHVGAVRQRLESASS